MLRLFIRSLGVGSEKQTQIPFGNDKQNDNDKGNDKGKGKGKDESERQISFGNDNKSATASGRLSFPKGIGVCCSG